MDFDDILYSSVKCYQMISNYILIPHSTGTLLVFPPEALIRVNSALLYFILSITWFSLLILKYLITFLVLSMKSLFIIEPLIPIHQRTKN